MVTLRQYLIKIKNNEPFNFDKFLKKLPTQFNQPSRKLFQSKLTSLNPKKWVVSCSKETLSELWKITETPKDRAHASLLGNSHNHRVSANLLMVYHQDISDSLCPDIIYASRTQVVQKFTPKKKLLLIENEENFIQYRVFSQILSDLTSHRIDIEDTDIALGGGNRASSQFLMEVYSKYDDVLCSFDYDLGGLKIFRSLKNELGGRAHFVQPIEYPKVSSLFNKPPESDKKLLSAIETAKELGFLELAETFHETRHFMEQESLLGEINV